MAASTFALVIACILLAVNGAVLSPKAEVQTAFEFVGSADGKIYIIANELGYVDFFTAIQTCHKAGYSPARITSQAQEDVVGNYFTSNNHNGFAWIDGSDFVTHGEWFSLHTGEKLEFFNWVSGRPVEEGTETERRCLMWKRDTFNGGWWDIPCNDYTNYAFCEVPASQYL